MCKAEKKKLISLAVSYYSEYKSSQIKGKTLERAIKAKHRYEGIHTACVVMGLYNELCEAIDKWGDNLIYGHLCNMGGRK